MNPTAIVPGGGVSETIARAYVKPLIAVVLIVVAVLVIRKIYKAIKLRKVGKIPYDKNDLNPDLNYDNYANEVHEAFTGWFPDFGSTQEAVSGRLMSLSDNELKYVYNRYNNLFGKGTVTMYQDMSDTTFAFFMPNFDAVLLRMQRLGMV